MWKCRFCNQEYQAEKGEQGKFETWECPNCGSDNYFEEEIKTNSCPSCGAEGRIPCNSCQHDYFGECEFGVLENVLSKGVGSSQVCLKFKCNCELME